MELSSKSATTLQTYMKSKKVEGLFVELMENLLVEGPDNPIKFIVDYMFEHFPDQAKESSFAKTFATGNNPGGGVVLTGLAASKNGEYRDNDAASDDSDSDSDSDSDEEEDEKDDVPGQDMPMLKKRWDGVSARASSRRISVFGESTGTIDMNQGAADKLPKIPKEAKEAQRIRDGICRNVLFQHLELENKQLDLVVACMFRKEHKTGDLVIKQGADGDNFYVVDEGTLEVTIGKETAPVATCTAGDSFGELALMYNAPRAADVTAKTDAKLWALDRVAYKTILLEETLRRRQEYYKYLDTVPILEPLTEIERLTIADSLVKRTYGKNEEVIRQNEAGDSFYIIIEGEVSCTQQRSMQDPAVEIAVLGKGSYFGEIALLTNRPRAATVTTRTDTVVCLTLERKTFSRLAGNLIEILKRNMNLYRQFISDKI